MSIAVGIFDLFAYTVPGALYVALLGYLAFRLGVLDPHALSGANGFLLAAGAVLLAYLLGFVAYPLGAVVNRLVPKRRRRDSRAEFLRRNPAARDRDYVRADSFLLLCALQLHDLDVAAEVSRLRAGGLMSRNAAPPIMLAALVALAEAFAGGHPVVAACLAVVLAVVAGTLVTEGRKMGYWASLKTLELCFWLPDVDERTRSAQP